MNPESQMKPTRSFVLVLAAAAALLTGCNTAPRTPAYDAKFGESVRQARAIQTLNPDAGRNDDPVTGLDGESARHAIERYQDSFRAPAASFEVLGIGGSSGSGGGGQGSR